jgi:KipI family sensor histidine kinase inhibitor
MNTASTVAVTSQPYGDSALLVTTGGGTPAQRWEIIHCLAAALEAQPPVGVYDYVAAYDSLLIQIDTVPGLHEQIQTWVHHARASEAHHEMCPPRTFHIPTVYGGEHGADLNEVAAQLDLSVDQVIALHADTDWVVRIMGAPAGAPMMDRAPFLAPVSRRPEPRTSVPAGSVGLAGHQSVIYPVNSPGGWRLIGRTPVRLVDIGHNPPTPYRPGDIFRFEPINATEWASHEGHRPEPIHG